MRITAVSYLNTIPFLYGLQNAGLLRGHQLELAVPSECARRLKDGETDIALVPAGALKEIQHARIITDFCLGANGPVGSVFLVAGLPPERLRKVFLDTDSRTSVILARIMFSRYWHTMPEFVHGLGGFNPEDPGDTAAVVIGDKAFAFLDRMPWVLDLSGEWKLHTGMPFVFAVWMARESVDAAFEKQFNNALAYGTTHIRDALANYPKQDQCPDPQYYLSNSISYPFDSLKREALQMFLSLADNPGMDREEPDQPGHDAR